VQCFVRQSTVASPGWNALPQNGEINDKFGTYKSLCCGAEIVINSGARFPDCPRHLNLPTIWKAIAEEKIEEKVDEKVVTPIRNKPDVHPLVEVHVDNRRLFNVAAGRTSLEQWEREHLHVCNVCQGVFYVFIRQPILGSSESSEKPKDAA